MTEGPFGLSLFAPQAVFYLRFEPLTHGVLWSMAANVLMFVTVSLLRAPEPVERLQAHVFVQDDLPRPPITPAFRLWRTSVKAGDLQHDVAQHMGAEGGETEVAGSS